MTLGIRLLTHPVGWRLLDCAVFALGVYFGILVRAGELVLPSHIAQGAEGVLEWSIPLSFAGPFLLGSALTPARTRMSVPPWASLILAPMAGFGLWAALARCSSGAGTKLLMGFVASALLALLLGELMGRDTVIRWFLAKRLSGAAELPWWFSIGAFAGLLLGALLLLSTWEQIVYTRLRGVAEEANLAAVKLVLQEDGHKLGGSDDAEKIMKGLAQECLPLDAALSAASFRYGRLHFGSTRAVPPPPPAADVVHRFFIFPDYDVLVGEQGGRATWKLICYS